MNSREEFWRGVREMLGPSLGISAWALVTGVAMVKSGLSIPVATTMSLLVYAGSAQLAALPLIIAGAPLWVLFATAFCVNMRFVIYSAQWRKYFGDRPRWQRALLGYMAVDLGYVLFMRRFPAQRPAPDQWPHFWGAATWNWLSWQVPSLVGIVLADRVPTQWGLEFAGVLALLGVGYSLLSGRKSWVAGGIAAVAAVAAFGLPLKLNIVVAIASGVAVGMLLDRWLPNGEPQQ